MRAKAAPCAADTQEVHLVAVVILGWLGVALLVGTVVGHGMTLGARTDRV
jgi:hypothetical protein